MIDPAGFSLEKYRGKWGGKIESGEEMWWSEPNPRLATSWRARLGFALDVRQGLILRFWRRALQGRSAHALQVADFGCGTGGTTINFATYLGVSITGMDIFETQLEIARRFAARSSVAGRTPLCRFERIGADGRLPLADQSLDILISLDVLGHVPSIPAALAEFTRVLKPGGSVLLFTEAAFSPSDRSLAARLAKQGADLVAAVPEHISLFPREELERMFEFARLGIRERFSANVAHLFFFPKDYVLLLRGRAGFAFWYCVAWLWNRISKITPFYPWPFQVLRLWLTRLFGRSAYGTAYFYHLVKA